MSRRILITGASVAGNTAAWWLGRAGFDVEVVERTPAFRDGGQNIDVRGVGREGLEQAALDRGTGEEGTAWVNGDGSVAAQFITADLGADGPTAEMEILRGDLARLLYEPAAARATYRFGDSVAAIDEDDEAAIVTFASGRTARYDAVIVRPLAKVTIAASSSSSIAATLSPRGWDRRPDRASSPTRMRRAGWT
jgi:2-polyprenyl-6-methoxyphenol hydroxylase-like FAD-dependent oxidoreductase